MKLRELLELCGTQEIIIRQGTKEGVTGSTPVGHFTFIKPIPYEVLEREVLNYVPIVIEKYERKTGALMVHLKGYVAY